MLSMFVSLKSRVAFKLEKVYVDNLLFQAHYRFTFGFLLCCTILVCLREYFGEHIKCLVQDGGVPEKVINTYCFFTSTFTVTKHFNQSLVDSGYLAHPGVGPKMETDDITHHAYYQWVPFVLFAQALCFYLPHYIWKGKEGGRVRTLVEGLHFTTMAGDEDVTANGIKVYSRANVTDRLETIRNDFMTRLSASNPWSTWLVACEMANLINVILQIWFLDMFLGGKFFSLGFHLYKIDWATTQMDYLDEVFPKVTKCVFYKYGPSGAIQNHDTMCVMALNIIHEKIFLILWFWFFILVILSFLGIVWRIVTFFLHSRSVRFNELVYSMASPGELDMKNIMMVTRECYFSDWLFLYYLAKNMNPHVFRLLFTSLAQDLGENNAFRTPSTYPNSQASTEDERQPMMDKAKLELYSTPENVADLIQVDEQAEALPVKESIKLKSI